MPWFQMPIRQCLAFRFYNGDDTWLRSCRSASCRHMLQTALCVAHLQPQRSGPFLPVFFFLFTMTTRCAATPTTLHVVSGFYLRQLPQACMGDAHR